MSFLHHVLALIRPGAGTAALGEWTAARYLKSQGYRILARNLRSRFGEIDILAQDPDGRTVVVVEVKAAAREKVESEREKVKSSKTRPGTPSPAAAPRIVGGPLSRVAARKLAAGEGKPATPVVSPRPEEHVNRHKQRKLAALAAQLVRRYRLEDRPVRFDVVGVDLPRRARPVIRHHRGAFESYA